MILFIKKKKNIIYIYDNKVVIQLSYVCPAGEEDEEWGAPEAKHQNLFQGRELTFQTQKIDIQKCTYSSIIQIIKFLTIKENIFQKNVVFLH